MHLVSHWPMLKSIANNIGASHEHTRSDRDEYVNILERNILPGAQHNFEKQSSDQTYSPRGTPFDANSVLMFGSTDFGILDSPGQRRATILPVKPGYDIR